MALTFYCGKRQSFTISFSSINPLYLRTLKTRQWSILYWSLTILSVSVSLTVEKASGQLIAYNAYCVFLSISRSYFTIFDLSWASNLHAAEILASDKEGRRVLINETVAPCKRNSRLSGYML